MTVAAIGAIQDTQLLGEAGDMLRRGDGVKHTFLDAIGELNGQVQATESTMAEFLITGRGDINSLVIGTEEIRLRLAYLNQVRNKIVEAYQDITKMQI